MTAENTKPTTKPATKPRAKAPQDRKPPTAEVEAEKRAERAELLAGMPELRPAYSFRLRHRNQFENLMIDAGAAGAFDSGEDDEGSLEFDLSNPDDVKRFKALTEFGAQVDEWAETIATDPDAYAQWAAGKDIQVFLALLSFYQEALGELRSSGD